MIEELDVEIDIFGSIKKSWYRSHILNLGAWRSS